MPTTDGGAGPLTDAFKEATMKKILALFLAVLMVSSAWVFTATAAGTTTGEIIVPISTCDTMDGFEQTAVNKDIFSVDDGTLAFKFNGKKTGCSDTTGFIKYQYSRPNGTLDASAMKTLCFDLYVNDADAIQKTRFELELRDKNGGDDIGELVSTGTITEIWGKALVDGWNHIEIKISDLRTDGTVNMSEWNYFRIYAIDGHGTEGETVVKLDNVYMTNREAIVESVTITPSGYSYTVTSEENKVFFQYGKKLSKSFNISELTALEFDLTINDVETQKNWKFDIELTSSGVCDYQEIALTQVSIARLAKYSGITLAKGINHFKIPIATFVARTDYPSGKKDDSSAGPFDETRWNYFRMYNNGSVAGGYSITLSNVELTKADVINYEGGSEAINYKYGSAVFESGEWNLLNSADGLSKKGTGDAINSSFVFTPQMFAKVSAIDCEIYVDNSALLDLNICFELTSSGTCDWYENSRTASIRNIFTRTDEKELELNTWNSVRINVASFAESGREGTSLDHPYANFIRIFNDGEWNTTGSTVFKLRNLTLVGAKTDAPETSEKVTEPEKPGVDNLMRFDNGNYSINNNKALAFVNAEGNTLYKFGQRKTIFSGSTLDVSGADAMFFDLYLENYADLCVVPFEFEVTSSGKPDTNESHLSGTLSTIFFRLDGQDLQDGWNSVYVPLDSSMWSYGCDWSKVNWISIFNNNGKFDFVPNANVVAAIDNLCFTTYAAYNNMKEFSSVASVSIEGAALQLHKSLNVVFYANVHESISEASMLFTIGNRSYNVTGTRTDTLNRMKFTLENVMPYQIGEKISATLSAFTYDGKLLTDSVSDYSIAQYCMNIINSIDNRSVSDPGSTVRNLMCSVLNYGIAAGKFKGHEDSEIRSIIGNFVPTTDGLDTTASQYKGVIGDKGDCPAVFYKDMASVGGVIQYQVAFTADSIEGLKLIHSTNKGGKQEITEFKTDSDNDGSYYYIELEILPYEINTAHTFYFEGHEDYKFVTSFGTYLNDSYDGLADESLVRDLYDAIYAYCAATIRYADLMN